MRRSPAVEGLSVTRVLASSSSTSMGTGRMAVGLATRTMEPLEVSWVDADDDLCDDSAGLVVCVVADDRRDSDESSTRSGRATVGTLVTSLRADDTSDA